MFEIQSDFNILISFKRIFVHMISNNFSGYGKTVNCFWNAAYGIQFTGSFGKRFTCFRSIWYHTIQEIKTETEVFDE